MFSKHYKCEDEVIKYKYHEENSVILYIFGSLFGYKFFVYIFIHFQQILWMKFLEYKIVFVLFHINTNDYMLTLTNNNL